MPISPIENGDTGLAVRTKMNAAIAGVNDHEARLDGVDAAVAGVQQGLAGVQQGVDQAAAGYEGLDARFDNVDERIAVCADLIGAVQVEVSASARYSDDATAPRPGEDGGFFGAQTDGAPSSIPPLASSQKVTSQHGRQAVISGAGTIAPIAASRVEPLKVYRARFVVMRAVDTLDPASDAVRLALRCLASDKSGLSAIVLADVLDLYVASGRQEFAFNFAAQDGDGVDFVVPAGAVYVRPFVQAFGSGTTHVEVIEITDLTAAADYSPDLTQAYRQIASLEARLSDALDRIAALEA